MNYPLSFAVASAEISLHNEMPELNLMQIRQAVFTRFAPESTQIVHCVDNNIEMMFEDGSKAVFAADFSKPTQAFKSPELVQPLGKNTFNVKDNIGGIQGHSQGSGFPYVVIGIGDNWGVMYANVVIMCNNLKQACALADSFAATKTHLQTDWLARMLSQAALMGLSIRKYGE